MSAKPMDAVNQARLEGGASGAQAPVFADSDYQANTMAAPDRISPNHDHTLLNQVAAEARRARRATRNLAPSALAVSIEAALLPRLLLAHRNSDQATPAAPLPADAPAVEQLARLVIVHDLDRSTLLIEGLRDAGATVEQIYLELLAPAARHLGEMWADDTASFTEVTTGLLCLHHLLHQLSPAFQKGGGRPDVRRRALICPCPGDQHMFGATMVAEFMRRAGWDVVCTTLQTERDLCDRVAGEWFGVLGLSVSCDADLSQLAAMIRQARGRSVNRSLGVMVGGPVFLAHPELVALVGADATATDGRHAALQAEGLLTLLASPT